MVLKERRGSSPSAASGGLPSDHRVFLPPHTAWPSLLPSGLRGLPGNRTLGVGQGGVEDAEKFHAHKQQGRIDLRTETR